MLLEQTEEKVAITWQKGGAQLWEFLDMSLKKFSSLINHVIYQKGSKSDVVKSKMFLFSVSVSGGHAKQMVYVAFI